MFKKINCNSNLLYIKDCYDKKNNIFYLKKNTTINKIHIIKVYFEKYYIHLLT